DGLHLRIVQTGETHSLPLPAGLRFEDIYRNIRWFPDEARLLLGLDDKLWAISIFGGLPQVLINREVGDPAISPDGSLIAFSTNGFKEIWLMNARGEQPHRIIAALGDDLIGRPTFFPDGQRVLFGRAHPTEGGFVFTAESSDLDGNHQRVSFSFGGYTD